MFVLTGVICGGPGGSRESPSRMARVRCASASTERYFLISGDGIPVGQSRGRYTDERSFVSCLEESWALKTEREEKEWRSLAVAGLAEGGGAGNLKCC